MKLSEIEKRLKSASALLQSLETQAERLKKKLEHIEQKSVKKYSENEVDLILERTVGGIREVNSMQNETIDRIRFELGMIKVPSKNSGKFPARVETALGEPEF